MFTMENIPKNQTKLRNNSQMKDEANFSKLRKTEEAKNYASYIKVMERK